MASSELIDKAKAVLADTFVLYMKTHGYHWNVIGSDFPQYHKFFGKMYVELHDAIDDIAEQIRQLDSFAPGTLSRMIELSEIKEDDKIPTADKMISNLLAANEQVLGCLKECYDLSDDEPAFNNFLQDRMMAHKKHAWMLRAVSGIKS